VIYQKDNLEKTTEIKAELVHLDDQNNPTLRGELNGKWNMYERSFNPIIYPKMT
jgi:hypothetical protein